MSEVPVYAALSWRIMLLSMYVFILYWVGESTKFLILPVWAMTHLLKL